jgi:acetyl-CoA carboxylase carboxyl transferase alpha subunit/acetyl-CoA carboxylase carboxyl transferase beta subunit
VTPAPLSYPAALRIQARPSIEAQQAPEWVHCGGCGLMLYVKRLTRNLGVCPECGHHGRLPARTRIEQLADPGSFSELGLDICGGDPLQFVDSRPYAERLRDATERTGEREGAVFGTATIEGYPVVLLAMDFRFLGGSMGSAVGEAVARAADTAAQQRCPLVLVCASGGARMQEGVLSLLQMAKTSQALALLHEAGLLSVCILTDPTFGGVTASFATLGSIVVVESGALVGFAGPRVIEQTIRAAVPPGFQTAEFLLSHGLADRVESRAALRPLLAQLVRLHAPHDIGPGLNPPESDRVGADWLGWAEQPADDSPQTAPALSDGQFAPRDAWDIVQLARDIRRPTALDYLRDAFTDFVELHGDRCFRDDPAIVGGIARIGSRSMVVIGHQKGHDTRELVNHNFGMPHPEGYRKAMRLIDHAERSQLPVVTLVDTPGAYPGVEAEERGQAVAIAELIARSARLRVPVVSVVTGEGGSGGALALATGDRLLMLANTFYSVISPEGCAAILWRSATAAPDAARALSLTAADLLRLGLADAIVPEPPGGAQADPLAAAALLQAAVRTALTELCDLDVATLLAARQRRFRSVGQLPSALVPEEVRIA